MDQFSCLACRRSFPESELPKKFFRRVQQCPHCGSNRVVPDDGISIVMIQCPRCGEKELQKIPKVTAGKQVYVKCSKCSVNFPATVETL